VHRARNNGGGSSQPGNNNNPNKKKNSFFEYLKKIFKSISNKFNNLKTAIINKWDINIIIGIILLPFLVSLAYMTLYLPNYLDVNMAHYLLFKDSLA
jgi:hypothetical protein